MRRKTANVTNWEFGGQRVLVAEKAQIAPNLQAFGGHAAFVQLALNAWDTDSPAYIQTIEVPGIHLIPMTVAIGREEDTPPHVEWGIHVGHTGKNAGRSPFITFSGCHHMGAILTDFITVGFDPTAKQPTITHAYPGEYAPPLPWSPDVEMVEGGLEACIGYWRTHAYVVTPATRVMRMNSNTQQQPPNWWL